MTTIQRLGIVGIRSYGPDTEQVLAVDSGCAGAYVGRAPAYVDGAPRARGTGPVASGSPGGARGRRPCLCAAPRGKTRVRARRRARSCRGRAHGPAVRR